MSIALYAEVADDYGYWHDLTADLLEADPVTTGYRQSDPNRPLAAPGSAVILLKNDPTTKKYTPPQGLPAVTDTMAPGRRCRLRAKTSTLGKCLRMMNSGQGGPGGTLTAQATAAGQAVIGVTGVSTTERTQQFFMPGGVLSSIAFLVTANTVGINWKVYSDIGGLPGNVLYSGTVGTPNVGTFTTVTLAGGFFAPGTSLWLSVIPTSGINDNIGTSNGVQNYPGLVYFRGGGVGSWSQDTTSGNYCMKMTCVPQGTTVQQLVSQSGNAGDVLVFTFDERAQWDSQYNVMAVQIITSAENGPVTTISETNKYKTRTISFTTTAGYTSITVIIWACHNFAGQNCVYSEIRNCSLKKNGGAELLINRDFSASTTSISPWTETSQNDIALYGPDFYDTDVTLRGASAAGGTVSQLLNPNTTVIGNTGSGDQMVTMTFQPGGAGAFSAMQLYFGANNGSPFGTVTWELWSTYGGVGASANTRLAHGTFTPLPSQINPIYPPNGPFLSAGTTYMLVLYSTYTQSAGNAWTIQNSASDVYANGKLYTAAGDGGASGTTDPVTSYTAWTDTGFDMAFTLTTSAVSVKDKLAQSFVVFQSQATTVARLWTKKTGAPAGTMTLRVETDSNGQPSGTLADANATATKTEASLLTAYQWNIWSWAGSFTLTPNTKYWLVLSTSRASDGSNNVQWATNATSHFYLNGTTNDAMLYNASSTYSAENKTAIFDIVAPFTSCSVQDDTEIKFNGFLERATPAPHQIAGKWTTTLQTFDFMQLLALVPFNLPIQVNQKEDALIKALLGLMPSGSLTLTPPGTLLDAGLTTLPYAFDSYVQNKTQTDPGTNWIFIQAGEIVKAVQNKLYIQQAIDDVLKSCYGKFWCDEDGTWRFANRNQTPTLQSVAPTVSITEGVPTSGNQSPVGTSYTLDATSDISTILNQIFVNYHPRQLSTGNVVLWQLNIPPNTALYQYELKPRTFDKKTGAVIPGQLSFTGTFTDSAGKPISATSIATPVADSDFQIQWTQWGTQPAGSVYDITRAAVWPSPWGGLVTFSYTFIASQITITFYNWSSHPLYFAKLQVQGQALYSYNPINVQTIDPRTQGTIPTRIAHPFTLDMPFATDAALIASLVNYLLFRYKDPYLKGNSVTFEGRDSIKNQDASTADLLLTKMFDVVTIPDSQAGFVSPASGARHFCIGKTWSYVAAKSGGTLTKVTYVLDRCDPNLYAKYDDAVSGFYDQGYLYYI